MQIMQIVLYSFLFMLLVLTLITKQSQIQFLKRTKSDWVLDITSLAMHSFVLPLLNVLLLYKLLDLIIPELKGTVDFGWPGTILFHSLLDYGWYWNHRLFHSRTFIWNFHKVHHAPENLDILKTPRNSILSHFMMLYWWLIGIATFVALDPACILFVASIGLMINFWGHSPFDFPKDSKVKAIVSSIFITPCDHHWHHSSKMSYCNFATVFSFWDRMHGTLHRTGDFPDKYGFPTKDSTLKQLFYPGPN
jgi:sterol desaturase/sphingolipid hydroxylase (fatty acid hydroxylase superfamily)